MRRCLPGDLIAAARLVAAASPAAQPGLVARLIQQADAAHRYAKRFGRAHPLWGNGSLMARALAEAAPCRHSPQSAAFLHALACVAEGIAARPHQPRAK